MSNNEEIISAAKNLWDYHKMGHRLEKSDAILVLGSHDLRVATRGAELYLNGYAPLVIFSGGYGRLTKNLWEKPEAEKFSDIAIRLGVPREDILIENQSTNTGENILFTQKLLEKNHLNPESFIVVQKPYMERRTYATFAKQWPEKKFVVSSPEIAFEDYPNEEILFDTMLDAMVGDLQRIREYPSKGFQIDQEIPEEIWKSWEFLVANGYDRHLL